MRRVYCVTMPDGIRYGIPAGYITHLYAKFYEGKGEDYSENYQAMLRWFDNKDYSFKDWAKNNLDWSDVKDHAFVIPPKKIISCDYEDGWVKGQCEYLQDVPAAAIHAYEDSERRLSEKETIIL